MEKRLEVEDIEMGQEYLARMNLARVLNEMGKAEAAKTELEKAKKLKQIIKSEK